jgi:predicted ABC-type ATPase
MTRASGHFYFNQHEDISIAFRHDLYIPVVNSWKVYDNSLADSPLLVAEGVRGAEEVIYSQDTWSRIRSIANG